ncbi:MAG: ATP-dependent DNA helicase RecG [Betaproteobacteria bacterium]|nr:MAG: ATP-dependent DNA helicase RecG [Betaproteobacteria bacterium]
MKAAVASRAAALERKFQKLGLRSSFDFVLHLPLRYEDETVLTAPQDAIAGKAVLVEARVLRAEVAYRPRRQLVVHAEGLALRFFNFYQSQLKQFQRASEEGLLVRAFGEVRAGWFGAEMAHPRYRIVRAGEPLPASLTPIYPATAGVGQAVLRARILEELDAADLQDTLPEALRRKHELAAFAGSVELLHRPRPGAEMSAAWRRVKFDELLAQQLSMRFAYRRRRSRAAPVLKLNGALLKRFLSALPFALTRAQTRAMNEILRDLREPHPMQRLLQGDVGSGKTIVAAIACLAAVDSGTQAAVMAPTEILSEQHRRKFSEWLEPLGVRLGYLRGGMGKKEKSEMLEARVLIGTHALIQEDVEFSRLGLVVVDEQHRFGVEQRLALRKKAAASTRGLASPAAVPHQLMMSATPIPRTLSMTYFADLDVSTLDEMPPGRRAVTTKLLSDKRRPEVLARIREACAEGQQAYWVCPVIEESKAGLSTALKTYEVLKKELSGLRVELLHGRMPAAEKAATLRGFLQHRIQVLVATTVIEVGVDVPNASLMVIESAERFGLAQLHQLRGRIGRGARASVCILLYGELQGNARERLKVIFESADGFEIARKDLELRGPGEFLGERQSGAPLLRFADLERDKDLVEAAVQAAAGLIDADPRAARAHVERWLGSRQELTHA